MSILTQAIDESRRKREQAGGQERKSVLRQAIDQARQGGPGVTLPTARQGTVTLPRADQGMGDAGTASPAPIGPNPGSLAGAVRGTALAASGQGRETGRESPAPHSQGAVLPTASSLIQRPPFVPASAASRVPSLGARDMDVVQREIDGVDSVIQKLRERQNELDGQARQMDSRARAMKNRAGAYANLVRDDSSAAQAAQLHSQAQEVGKAIAQMEGSRAALRAEWEQADEQGFNRVRQTEGFRATVDKAMGSPIGVVTANSRNPSHYDVSSAMTYFQAKARGEERLAEAAKGSADMALDRMSKAQQERLAYYVGMGDYDGAAAYLNRIAPALNRAEAENLEQGMAEWAQKHPVQGAMTNIVSWPLNIPAYFANAGQAAKNLVTGKDEQDPHASAYGMTRIGTGTAQGTQEAARSAATQAFGSEAAGDVAAFLTGTGLSIGQNAAQIALLGPGSLAAMSMSAAGGSTADALGRGATPGQALALGTASGLTEALTEKLPLDNLFRLAKEGGGRGVKATVMELLKQMGTEASEEAISEIAGNLADAVVMGDKSELSAYVRELQEAGMSREDAQRAAALKFYGANVGLAALGGGISGGVMGGGALTFHRAGELAQRLNAGKQGPAQTNAAIDRAYQAMVEKGMFSQEAGQAIASAQDEIGNYNPLLPTGERAVDIREGVVPATMGGDAARGDQEAAGTAREDGGIITPQAGQDAPQGARSAVPGRNGAAPTGEAVRDNPGEAAGKDQRANVPESDTGAGRERWLDGLQDTVRQLREDYAQGKIDDAAFDGMMDAIEEQAALEGMERSEVWRRLDGDVGGLITKGAEYGTDEQRAAAQGGQQLFDRGAGRDIDAGAGGQAGGVEGGGSQRAADTGRAAVERGNLGKSLRLEAVSSRELGLANGTDARTVRVLPEDAWDGELRDTARKVRRETGLGVRFVLGGIQVTGSDGEAHQVRGVYGRDGIIVQADHLRVGPGRIADHEIFHSYADSDPGLVRAAEDAVVERYGREEFDGVVTEYLMRLRGIIDVPESGTMDDLAFAQAVAEAKNEVLADAFAGINAFGTQAAKYQEAVYDTLEDRGTAAPRGRENAQATDSRRGPPAEQFSFEGRTEDGIEVYETSEEIKRLPYKQRVAAFLDLMRGEYRGRTAKFTAGDGRVFYAQFDEADLRKNIYGDKRSSPRGWKAKINAGADGTIFELVENAQYKGGKAEQGKQTAAHQGLSGWEYFVKPVQIDGQVYDLLANVRKKPDGEYVYSIQLNESTKKTPAPPRQYRGGTAQSGNSRPVGVPTDVFQEAPAPSLAPAYTDENTPDGYTQNRMLTGASAEDVTQDIYGSYGQGPKSVFLRNASMDNIPQAGAAVKGGGLFFPTAEQGTAMLPKGKDTMGRTRFSVDYDTDNRPFVTVEEDILDGVPKSEWPARVREVLAERFPNGVRVGANTIKINSQTRGEMTFSEYTKRLRKADGSAYANKLRAAANADEIILASRNYVNEGLKHSREDNIKDFARGTVQLRVGASDYTADVVVGTTAGGEMLLYDIVNLQKTVIQGNKKSGAEFTAQPHEARRAVDSSTPTQSAAPASDGNSIPQAGAAVKPWDGMLPRGTDGSVTLPGGVSDSDTAGTERFSVDDNSVSDSGTFEDGIMLNKGGEAIDGSMLPTLAEVQARKARAAQEAQENAGDVSDSDTGKQTPGQDVVEALPAKARDYLQRAERRLINKIGELLSVPKSARRKFLQDIVRGISTEYLRTGQVSQETRDQLFERAYEQGVIADREYYDTYKHVRDYLRTTPIMVSEWLKGDIDDYNEWRKGAFGTLRLVKKGGIGPDAAYMELQHMAPGLFPDGIIHPADQLRHILETAKGIRVSEQSLKEAYGPEAEEFKRWSRRDFDEAVAEALGELRQVRRYADERAQQAQARQEARTPMTVQETAVLYGQMRGAQRVYQRAAARNLLTQHDEIQVGRLLRGELELEHLDPAKDNVRGITAVYEAKREYEELAGRIREWNQQRKAALREQADGFLENANQWKDKPAGILYSRETMERNIRDIVPDRALADRINKTYFQPVHHAAAAANKMKNEYRDRVRALNLSRKKAAGDAVSEAHAVQLLGEAEDNIRWLEDRHGRAEKRDGKTIQEWQAVIGELWEKNPGLDQKKIRGAVEEFRAIYDELFQQMNEVRVRNGYEPVSYRQGYFPHFQADSEGLMAQFGRALGIETAVTNLPTTINGLTHTFKSGIQYFGNALERKGFDTAYDAVQGFDRYIEGAADVIHQTDNIQALRALAAQIRDRTTHDNVKAQIESVKADNELTAEDKLAQIKELREKGQFALSRFVVELDEYTNLLANKKSRKDRDMEHDAGRRMYNIVKWFEGRVAANMVAVNPASWLTNFVPLTQGWGAVKTKFMLEGMWDTLKACKEDDGMVGMSSFLTNRRGSDPIVRTWQQSASAKLSTPMEYIDCFTADSLVRARFKQNQAAGLSEAASIEEADAWAAGVMADRSKGATPTLFNRSNPLTKLFTQFQLEVNNQLSYLFKDLPSDAGRKGAAALAAALLKFFLGAYLYNEVYEYFIGRRCALDPIGILNDTVGDFTGYQIPNVVGMAVDAAQGKEISFETEKKSALDAAVGLGKNVAEEIPFAGGVLGGGRVPISSALPDWGNVGKAVLNDGWSDEKRVATAAKELGKPLTYVLPPFGGGQIKKIYQGLKAVAEGGSYTVDSKGNDILQYPVFNETLKDGLLTLPTALMFGRSSLPTAREWAERGFKSMNAKQTACYQGMTELGVPQRDAYQLLRDLGDVEAPAGEDVPATERAMYQKRKLLQEADISAQGKGVVYYTLFASDKERELMDGLEDKGEAAKVLMELKDAGAEHKGGEMSAARKKAIMGSSLSEEEKDAIFRYVLGKDSKGAGYSQTFAAAGLDERTAAAAANALNGLTPEEGRKTVSDAQKWRAVLGAVKDTQGQKAALLAVMGGSARARYEIADSFGIQPEAWVQLKEALPQFDENGNGSYSGAEIEKAIDALGGDGSLLAPWDKEPLRLSREEKAVLWQLFTGNKSGSGNPYSTRVGRQAAKALEEAREEE